MRRSLLLLILSGTLSLGLAELALRGFTRFPIDEESNRLDHPELGYTLDPALSDVDEKGFRNPTLPDPVVVAAIGDSHTFGVNVAREEAWPAHLEDLSGERVYNLGVGSYDVYRYAVLFDLALELEPDWIIVALYPANDLGGRSACGIMVRPSWDERRRTLGLDITECRAVLQSRASEESRDAGPPADSDRAGSSLPGRIVSWALTRTALGSLVDNVIVEPLKPPPAYEVTVARERLRVSVANVRSHAGATDLSDPVTRTNLENALRILTHLDSVSRARDVRLGVLLIPSKARVVAELPGAYRGALPESMSLSVRREREVTDILTRHLASLSVPVESPLEGLVGALADEVASGRVTVYPAVDGHPMSAGYRIYAEAAARLRQGGR